MALAARHETELTFHSFDRESNSPILLPINEETLSDPQYTYPIFNTLLYETDFNRALVTSTFSRVIAFSQPQKEGEDQKSAGEIISLDDSTLRRAGVIGKHLEVFRTATDHVRERLIDSFLPPAA